MTITSQKRKAMKSQGNKQQTNQQIVNESDVKKSTRIVGPTQANIVPIGQKNKAYQRFKKLVEKTSIHKRQAAQVSSIKTRNELLKSRRKPFQTAITIELDNDPPETVKEDHQSYFDTNYSRQSLNEKREFFYLSLRELKEKLAFVKSVGINAKDVSQVLTATNKNFEKEYLSELTSLDEESVASLCSIKMWHESQQHEIERQFKCDQRQANREFQKKRIELKKRLAYKYEDMQKQVEAESPLLDINMDLHEMSKLPRTRNLRKRINTNVLMYNFEHSIDWLSLDAALAAKKNGQHDTAASCMDILARCAAGEHTSGDYDEEKITSVKMDQHSDSDSSSDSNLCSDQFDLNNNENENGLEADFGELDHLPNFE